MTKDRALAWPARGGEMSALIREFDWSKTGLGSIADWPQSLRTITETLLLTPVPIVLLWGAEGIMIYNDAYSVFAGGRHPSLLGSKVREGWPEVADFNDHVMKVGLKGGTLSYRDQELTLHRKGHPEQVWMNLDYSPVLDESGKPAGVMAIVVETTDRILAQRAQAKAEERLSHALNAAGMVGTFDWHIASDIFYSDPRFASMFSVDPEKGESGAPLSEYLAGIHPDDRDRIGKMIEHTIATGERYSQEYRLLQKDGTIRWIEARGECLYDEQGRPSRFPGAVVDITERKTAEQALQESEERRRMATEAGQIGVWDFDLVSDTLRWDARTKALFGLSSDAVVTYELFLAGLHPEDRQAADAAVQRAFDPNSGGKYDIEYRTVGIDDRIVRWIAAKGKCFFENGKALRFGGTVIDIGVIREATERQRLLLREMNHRVKNLFAIVAGMIALSARSARTPQDMAQSLRSRLDALMRANDLVKPGIMSMNQVAGEQTTMEALVRTVLQPYEGTGTGNRIQIRGPEVAVGPKAATSLALMLHESATNAAKYGSLSEPIGSICIEWKRNGDQVVLWWEENGGPPIRSAPSNRGFGSILAERSIVGQLGGAIDHDWRPEGIRIEASIPTERLEV